MAKSWWLKEEGYWQVPESWPRWNLKCTAHGHKTKLPCRNWAVRGMPTCRFHGSGGERNKQLGMVRYMCWIITGGPQNQPVELAATVALHVFAEAVLKQGKGTVEQQMKAAMWITKMLDD